MLFSSSDASVMRNKTCSNMLKLTLNSLKKQSAQTTPMEIHCSIQRSDPWTSHRLVKFRGPLCWPALRLSGAVTHGREGKSSPGLLLQSSSCSHHGGLREQSPPPPPRPILLSSDLPQAPILPLGEFVCFRSFILPDMFWISDTGALYQSHTRNLTWLCGCGCGCFIFFMYQCNTSVQPNDTYFTFRWIWLQRACRVACTPFSVIHAYDIIQVLQ